MRKLLIILFLALSPIATATNYYVKNGGNDSYTGLSDAQAWATIAKLNGHTFSPGDSILFKRGSTWRLIGENFTPNSGTSGGDVIVSCYGTGAKPILCASKQENQTSDWTNLGSNLWQDADAAFGGSGTSYDVGCLWFNNGTSVGVKKQTIGAVTAQGDFWFDFANNRIRMYSVGNPATFYSNIECTLKDNVIETHGTSYITFDRLDIRLTGAHGIHSEPSSHITIKHCDFSYIGGSDLYNDHTVRYGNGVEFYGNASYETVEYCTFYEIYDTGITNQELTGGGGITMTHLSYHHNIFRNMEWPFEYALTGATSSHSYVYFENNTIINAGGQLCHTQRWQGELSASIMFWGSDPHITNGYIRNNIFHQDEGIDNGGAWHAIQIYGNSGDEGFTIDYNLFDLGLSDANIYTGGYPYYQDLKTLANWRTASGKDAHSLAGSAVFVADYSNVRLQATSAAIDHGVGCGYTVDFDGNTIGANPDIGAFEYGTSVLPPPDLPTVYATAAQNYTAISTTIGGTVASNGGGTLTFMGVCWSTSPNPTILDNRTIAVGVLGDFNHYICTLHGGITYHFRAYAINETGTGYGSDISFTTPPFSVVKGNGHRSHLGKPLIVK